MWSGLSALLLLASASCANTVERASLGLSKQIVLDVTVEGALATNNPNITYYVVLNAPQGKKGSPIDPGTEGPRFNGPDFNQPNTALEGRLPFTGLLPGDIESKWTHFYYLRGSSNDQGEVGYGRLNPSGQPEVIQRNYPPNFWRVNNGKTLQLQILFSDLGFEDEESLPQNFTANIGVGDNFETGQGFVYDTWQLNVPFRIETNNISPTPVTDSNPLPNPLRQIPNRFLPQLPSPSTAVNIVSYSYQIR